MATRRVVVPARRAAHDRARDDRVVADDPAHHRLPRGRRDRAARLARASARAERGREELRAALTLTPLLVRLAADALARHRYVNASIDVEREQIVLHEARNIGIATAGARGTGGARGSRRRREERRATRDRDRRAHRRGARAPPAPGQLTGGTFTVNNFGSLGVWLGTPIIKPGEVANLGFGRVQERVVARDGRAIVRPVAGLAVSGDHRVLDGQTLAAFVTDVVALIEEPPER